MILDDHLLFIYTKSTTCVFTIDTDTRIMYSLHCVRMQCEPGDWPLGATQNRPHGGNERGAEGVRGHAAGQQTAQATGVSGRGG